MKFRLPGETVVFVHERIRVMNANTVIDASKLRMTYHK